MEPFVVEPVTAGVVNPVPDVLRLAVAAYLARFKGQSRIHCESDLRSYLTWCQDHGLPPLTAQRGHVELYVRWMQEVRTVQVFHGVAAGLDRGRLLPHLRDRRAARALTSRPRPPAADLQRVPTLGLTHLQFEAILTAARDSTNDCDFALVAMLGLLGLRIFEATGANIEDVGEEHGHRVLLVRGKGDKHVLTPLPPAVARAIERAAGSRAAGRSCSTGVPTGWTDTALPVDCAISPIRPASPARGCIPTCSATPTSRPCWTPGSTSAMSRSPPATPTPAPRCATTELERTSTDTPTTCSPPTWPPARSPQR